MDNLRLILIIMALLAMVVLLVHGFWINKKERSTSFPFEKSAGQPMPADEQIGSDQKGQMNPVGGVSVPSQILSSIDESVSSKLTIRSADVDRSLQQDPFVSTDDPSKIPPALTTESNQKLGDSHLNFDHKKGKWLSDEAPSAKEITPIGRAWHVKKRAKQSVLSDVLVMHVAGINGAKLNGSTLLDSILSAGFQYGDMQIFHRHVDPMGNGAVLYSLANMVKPGYLNPDTMLDMLTPGISLFMMVPSFGDNQKNFKMMLQSAQRIADDVKGVVLDDQYRMITPQKIDHYRERIKQLTNQQLGNSST